jgi:cell fate (sporulation/competence/biofilm development) regulator YmcA (YheA/YmcA/DUF963 family)
MDNNKIGNLYCCDKCSYDTFSKKDFDKHLSTLKHNRNINTNSNVPMKKTSYECVCGKKYNHMSSLCKHKKLCKVIQPEEDIFSLLQEQKRENKEIKSLLNTVLKQFTTMNKSVLLLRAQNEFPEELAILQKE